MKPLSIGSFAAANTGASGVIPPPPVSEWTLRTASADKNWWDIAWSPTLGKFAAVAQGLSVLSTDNPFMSSSDGLTWTAGASASGASMDFRGIGWGGPVGNEQFVAAGTRGSTFKEIYTSVDGQNWVVGKGHTYFFRSVTWNGTAWFFTADQGFVGYWNGLSGGNIVQSTAQTYSGAEGSGFWGGPVGNEKLFILGGPGPYSGAKYIQRSSRTNGGGWAYCRGNVPNLTYRKAAYGNGVYVAVASAYNSGQGQVVTSPDGEDWTQQTLDPTQSAVEWRNVIFDGTRFIAVGRVASVSPTPPPSAVLAMTSTDGVNWTTETTPNVSTSWRGLAHNGSGLVAAAGNGVSATEAVMTKS